MKRSNKIIIGIGIVIVAVVSFHIIFPFFLVGSPLPLYYVQNEDDNSHEVVIEVFDPHNISILKETHDLSPKDSIEHPKPSSLKFTQVEGDYTFKVTLDGEITETFETEVYPHSMVDIGLYDEDSNSGEVTPIYIRVMVM